MRNFRTLQVWEKAHQLALAVYKATPTFPKTEMFGLTSQIRRASASIPANIAFDLHEKVTEVKRMATAFTKKLTADR